MARVAALIFRTLVVKVNGVIFFFKILIYSYMGQHLTNIALNIVAQVLIATGIVLLIRSMTRYYN